ncbi:uncharacterized protein F5891DRAFT_1131602 [Suillus fuscotomentosus]|uniref:Uncharacterized protein n=1 Tax=Suillus fuscotomentosus TaxID=1912939 RepID=A0AAD4DRE7_9AGAM|nr:uncharacterized protein F5891DRAFT_1131602 [Suillus fuscotomentosus]KAG1891577.1 hypothetical protein F5891DRAFT_1131602 [Suillus fuscotomentosus]
MQAINNHSEDDDFYPNNQMDYQHDVDMGRTDSNGDPPSSGTASPAPQHNIDNIKVEYHPNSGRPTKVYHFEDYGHGPGAPPVVPEADPTPWQPFRTCIDFEVAELAHDAGLSHEQLDGLIHLIHRSRIELFTLKNCKDVRDTWDTASFKMTPFTKEEVIVPFRGVDQTFLLFHHSLWDWVTNLLQDPQVGPNFVFNAPRLSKFNGKKFVQFIHEPWTTNAIWEYQSKIPPDAKPLAFILYANKAKVSSYVTRCANLPIAIHNGEGLGGGHVVGWLPIVKEDKKHSGKPAFVNFKNVVWHASFMKILDCLVPLSRFGSSVKCWDDLIRVFYPIVLILSADYEEQAVMALIHGLMGKFPCPICLVPCDELSNTLKSSFGILEHTDVHRALSHDKLHFNDKRLFSDHNFQSIPHWRNLNHFDQVIPVSFSDGTKYEDISKLIVVAAHNVFDHDTDPEAYLLLCCIRNYVEFNMYASLEVHTEDTIKNGREALSKLTELMDKYIEDTAEISKKSWNFLKKHLSAHLFDDIEAKGPNKKMHGPLKDAYQDRTNSKNFAEQQVAMSFTHIEAGSQGNPAFERFRIKLNDFLNCAFAANSIPDDRFNSLRISLVDWQTDTGIIFGKLVLIFTCTVGDVQYPVTLRKPRASAEFFSVHSIVQGCMIVEDVSRPDKFLIVDTIDTDMFLQMQDIRSQ